LPTNLPWGIPIAIISRPEGYEAYSYFHPTFLYESLGNLAIFIILANISNNKFKTGTILGFYAIFYGILRFLLEFIKIDQTPLALGLRWPQIASLALIAVGTLILILINKNGRKK
jgi:phosphatidylglycerol:prolipoprotein diacylglycerol transferase